MYSVECCACTANTRCAIPCYTDCACAALNKLATCYPPLNAVVLYACPGELAMFLACNMLLYAVPVLQRFAGSLHAMRYYALLCAVPALLRSAGSLGSLPGSPQLMLELTLCLSELPPHCCCAECARPALPPPAPQPLLSALALSCPSHGVPWSKDSLPLTFARPC